MTYQVEYTTSYGIFYVSLCLFYGGYFRLSLLGLRRSPVKECPAGLEKPPPPQGAKYRENAYENA